MGYWENTNGVIERGLFVNGYPIPQASTSTSGITLDRTDRQLIIGNYRPDRINNAAHNTKGLAISGFRVWHKRIDQSLATELYNLGNTASVFPSPPPSPPPPPPSPPSPPPSSRLLQQSETPAAPKTAALVITCSANGANVQTDMRRRFSVAKGETVVCASVGSYPTKESASLTGGHKTCGSSAKTQADERDHRQSRRQTR